MNNVTNLNKVKLPIPTLNEPLIQLDWIFERKIALYDNKSSKSNYESALSFYKKFLKATNNYNEDFKNNHLFYIDEQWDLIALYKIKQWLDKNNLKENLGYKTSYTINGFMSAMRQIMDYAYELNIISEPIINVSIDGVSRETDSREAYTIEEVDIIFKILKPMISFSTSLLSPYVKTGVGKDPRILNRAGVPKGSLLINQGWKDINNMKWYFENEMKCQPLVKIKGNEKHNNFFISAGNIHGGLKNLYKTWGLSSFIDQDIIIPLAIKLISETGLNADSLLNLKRDCFKISHPLTGLPFIEYYKERSLGETELHISLFDKNEISLKSKQSIIIKNTINNILRLTQPLVDLAPDDIKDFLFIYQTSAPNMVGKIKKLDTRITQNWTEKIMKSYNISNPDSKLKSFNLAKFRPTKITEMVREGYEFNEIQAVASHKSITTTLQYISKRNIMTKFHETINKALTNISQNKNEHEKNPLPFAIEEDAKPGKFIFKGPICSCKNPYDPPDIVKKSKEYFAGDPCTYWNMCLFCNNILITKDSLPKLISHRKDIEISLTNNLSEMFRHGELYEKKKSIIEEILKPDNMFTEEEIKWAEEISEIQEDEVLDGFIYQGVKLYDSRS